ncbi:MAG: hypothetical protein DI586_04045 [Micavibrio aeruginosavorus]|uniref:Phytoene synthase n=1 Tax=Micavibrio aeruginosavorus TaxID=349221 RepID=A0A2W5FR97_9BACT|nr:MAG: hypothetical protein DI586_04045 [Micavibrio aeruginosavorus]
MNSEDLEYCRQSLLKNDYYHYLISLFMPANKRPSLWVLGAFRQVIEDIPSSVSEPALGYMRLTWWRDQTDALEQGGLITGQPVLGAIQEFLPHHSLLKDFINEQETRIEQPDADFQSIAYPKLLQSVLGKDLHRYQKLENKLTEILKAHHGTRWENNPPFVAVRLWLKSLI